MRLTPAYKEWLVVAIGCALCGWVLGNIAWAIWVWFGS